MDPFASLWDDASLDRQRRLLRRTLAVAEAQDIRLFVFWGTLIGHVREGRILPWDDDVDLALFDPGDGQYARLCDGLKAEGLETSEADLGPGRVLKVYDASYAARTDKPWTWPFLDIFRYSTVADPLADGWADFPVPRDLVLPGRPVAFEGAPAWEPEHPLALLDLHYRGWRSTERTSAWNHQDEHANANIASRRIVTDVRGRKIYPPLANTPGSIEGLAANDPREPPHVDVVCCVRNGASDIGACLDRVRAQTLQPRAIVIVDDGSTDDTPRILAEQAARWSKIEVVRSDGPGIAHARNLGVAAARAPFVAFLDAPDLWHPHKLQRQMTLFTRARPELGLVHCAAGRIDADARAEIRGDIFDDMIRRFATIPGAASAVVARRDLMLAVGGFDETLSIGADHDMWLKLADRAHVDRVPDALVARRVPSVGIRPDPETILVETLIIWDRWLDHIIDQPDTLDQLRADVFMTSLRRKARLDLRVGTYRRLRARNLRLVDYLFPTHQSYWTGFARFLTRIGPSRLREGRSGMARRLGVPGA